MKIKQEVKLRPYDDDMSDGDQFLLLYREKSWLVTKPVADVVRILENDLSRDELMDIVCNDMLLHKSLSIDDAEIIIGFLRDNSLFEGQNAAAGRKMGEWLRITLIPDRITKRFKVLPALFSKATFCPGLLLSSLWLIFMLILYPPDRFSEILTGLSLSQLGWWFVGTAAISVFHEFGHVSALLKRGGVPGRIGISMNYFLPRGWSETNDVWRCSKTDQLYVDAGGLYFQLVVSMILFAINELSEKDETLLAVCLTSAIIALINLTPNPGTDGYWLVRDAFGIEDMGEEAKAMFGRQTDETSQKERKKKVLVSSLIVLRNMAVIYLLVLILNVLRSAVTVLIAEMALLPAEKRLNPSALLHIFQKRPACLIAISVSLQNVLQSARKVRRKPVS